MTRRLGGLLELGDYPFLADQRREAAHGRVPAYVGSTGSLRAGRSGTGCDR